ncbi:MAG: hypothetical protein RLZ84_1227, partial [Actinomycetota bacterium]
HVLPSVPIRDESAEARLMGVMQMTAANVASIAMMRRRIVATLDADC